MSDDKIPPHDARELADYFSAHARDLFGYACVLARGDQALAGDLVQAAFEAGCRTWQVVRALDEEQRSTWLRSTVATIAVSDFRSELSPPDRLPRIVDCYRNSEPDAAEEAFSAAVLDRSWQAIQDMPERHHVVALLHWHLGMKEAEIATALGLAETTVSADLDRARRSLLAQLEPDGPGTGEDPQPGGPLAPDGPSTAENPAPDVTLMQLAPDSSGTGEDLEPDTLIMQLVPYSPGTGEDPEPDVLLCRLYQQVTVLQETRFGAGYDLAGGLDTYRAWLRDERSADLAVMELYSQHYRSLVRLAVMLLRDTPTAEEVVQDSFVAMHGGWHRLEDTDKALAYLRQAVVNRSRSVLRHRVVVEKNLQNAPPDMPSAEHGAIALLERDAVVKALRNLPERQREAIVLRYYADLSEAEIAAAMGISRGAVKSHTARGMAALRAALEQE